MPYLVDGHNLIPKLGLSLEAADDEQQLIGQLQEFCRLRRKQVDVYFDNAAVGGIPVRKYGLVTAYFVRAGLPADSAMRERLTRLGAAAKNWIVVSSDHAVQGAARVVKAPYLPSEVFAEQMQAAFAARGSRPEKADDAAMNEDELNDWLALFGQRK